MSIKELLKYLVDRDLVFPGETNKYIRIGDYKACLFVIQQMLQICFYPFLLIISHQTYLTKRESK